MEQIVFNYVLQHWTDQKSKEFVFWIGSEHLDILSEYNSLILQLGKCEFQENRKHFVISFSDLFRIGGSRQELPTTKAKWSDSNESSEKEKIRHMFQ